MFTLSNISLAFSAITSALVAGLLYAYVCSVNPGLHQLKDAEYLAAMQSINEAIKNTVFFLAFFGALLLLPLSTYLYYGQPVSMRFWLLLAAAVAYFVGVFGVTLLGNVPLNEALANFDLAQASPEAIGQQRAQFEAPWNSFHLVRTLFSVLVEVLVVLACMSGQKDI